MGNRKSDATARQKFRKKLRSWGMDEEEIRLCVEQFSANQAAKNQRRLPPDAPMCTRAEYVRLLKKQANEHMGRWSKANAAVFKLGEDYDPRMDDSGYKPGSVDSVFVGPARATGQAAQSIKRGKALTKYQYDRA